MRKCRLTTCRLEIPKVKDSDWYQKNGFCANECMAAHGLARARATIEKHRRAEAAKGRKEHREAKERIKTRREWIKDAQVVWNRYVRARDAGLPCASCGARPSQKIGGTMDCSHYRSTGSAPHLRFHLHNAAAACVKCNRELSGNIVELRKGLIARIGKEKVEAIELNNQIKKFDINYLKRLKKVFKKKAEIAEKRYNARQQILAISVTSNHQFMGVNQ